VSLEKAVEVFPAHTNHVDGADVREHALGRPFVQKILRHADIETTLSIYKQRRRRVPDRVEDDALAW